MGMMKHYFIFDGKNSLEFGVRCAGTAFFEGSARSYTAHQIAGRDGALIEDDGYHDNDTLKLECFILGDVTRKKIDLFRQWMRSHRAAYYKLEEWLHPEEYRMANFVGKFEPEVSNYYRNASFELEFSCKPQHYLRAGEIERDATKLKSITNPTLERARPVITAAGPGRFRIGGFTFTKTTDAEIILDCETGKMTGGNSDAFYWEELNDLPYLDPGENEISVESEMSVKVTPRWFTK